MQSKTVIVVLVGDIESPKILSVACSFLFIVIFIFIFYLFIFILFFYLLRISAAQRRTYSTCAY